MEGQKAEGEGNATDFLNMAVLEAAQPRDVVRNVSDLDIALEGLAAVLGNALEVFHRPDERVYVVLHVLVTQATTMCLVGVRGLPVLKAQVLDVAELPARCVRLING